MNNFINKFRRITSTGLFIPEIDGLRFIAIFLVVLFHSQSLIMLNPNYGHVDNSWYFWFFKAIYSNGWQGVELFFVISGFILGLPFAKMHLQNTKKISLKSYFLRRITRLEPPYFILMILYFFLNIAKGEHSTETLFYHLLASLSYLHNIIFGNEVYLVSVAWSLEIEVQFYILAPVLAYVFCLSKFARRTTLITSILFFSACQFYLPWSVSTLYSFIQYFLIGFLLVDFYLEISLVTVNKFFSILIGFVSLFLILTINSHSSLLMHTLFISAVFIFYLLVLKTEFWKKVLSINIIATIGGMCYTIYLIHTPILHMFRKFSHYVRISDEYILNLFVLGLITFPFVLILSGIFFYYVEKPCMNKYWYKNILNKKFFRLSKSK